MTQLKHKLAPGPGRPKGSLSKGTILKLLSMKEEMRPHVQTAIRALVEIAGNPNYPAASRVSAATSILDRFYGKPKEDIRLSGDPDNPISHSIRVIFDEPGQPIKVIEGEIQEDKPSDN